MDVWLSTMFPFSRSFPQHSVKWSYEGISRTSTKVQGINMCNRRWCCRTWRLMSEVSIIIVAWGAHPIVQFGQSLVANLLSLAPLVVLRHTVRSRNWNFTFLDPRFVSQTIAILCVVLWTRNRTFVGKVFFWCGTLSFHITSGLFVNLTFCFCFPRFRIAFFESNANNTSFLWSSLHAPASFVCALKATTSSGVVARLLHLHSVSTLFHW